MNERDNLTRWNRAGLRRFEYVDGTGPLFLEQLKQDLLERFENRWSNLPPPVALSDETGLSVEQAQFQKNNLLVQQYYGEQRDIGWELIRVFSQACHVLTGHVNAHANEAYLRTATQWDNVRRLVELIDYHPAAATSASTQLVLLAKKGKKGEVTKGFQVKHLPPTGGEKVVFETLEDIFVDHALNELRPKDWDQSGDSPVVSDPVSESAEPAEPEYSEIANRPAYQLQDIGKSRPGITESRAAILNTLTEPEEFRIRDFLKLDTQNPGFPGGKTIPPTWLKEFKAKAEVICNFEAAETWADISEWKLTQIIAESDESLAEITGKNPDKIRTLKLKVALIGVYLDNLVYKKARLNNLLAPSPTISVPNELKTAWHANKKPKVEPGQVAMVTNAQFDLAEAVTIAAVNEKDDSISLTPSPLQYNWPKWKKSTTNLHVSPRWKRECWLNGSYVIRTEEPHGLTADAFICWKKGKNWGFAKVIEADERNMRLNIAGGLPEVTTELFEARPLEGNQMAADLEAIVLLGSSAAGNVVDPAVEETTPSVPATEMPFTIKKNPSGGGDDGGGFLPPGALSFGSFLFPSPMLPMDLVKAAVELLLSLGVMVIPSTGIPVLKSLPAGGLFSVPELPNDATDAEKLVHILDNLKDGDDAPVVDWGDKDEDEKITAINNLIKRADGAPTPLFKKIVANMKGKGPTLAICKNPPVKAVVIASSPRYVVNGSPGKMESGDWVVGEFSNGLRALKVRGIDEFTAGDKKETFSITFENLASTKNELKKIYADFRGMLIAEGSTVNTTPITGDEIELEEVPESLKIGRKILLTADGKEPATAKIKNIVGNNITITPSASGFSKGNLVIRGNVVDASHGSSKPIKRLSTGITTGKTFSLSFDVNNVSSVTDPTFPRGVRADVELVIDGLIWQQVPRLDASKPTDSHYAARATEEGYLRFEFGGRRPPSGTNNVSVRYRVGAGRSGNLVAGSLSKPVHPHPLIASVEQPSDSVGGEELESVEFMRDNAPATLLALERSVSLADFENLTMSRNDIWQARAFYHPAAGTYLDRVQVIVVPAGGGETSQTFRNELEKFLAYHALPTVSIKIKDYSPREIKLKIDLRIDLTKYDPVAVMADVRTRVLQEFALEKRQISQAFYLSEVYHMVEKTRGISDSICLFQDNSAHQLFTESEEQVIYLGSDPDDLLIDYTGYTP